MTRKALAATAITCLLSAAAAQPAAAQAPAGDTWHVTIAPYMMGAAMNGTTAIAGQEATIDMSASDIFENLQFGAMGLLVARRGNWGVGGDAIWMSLGANGTAPGPIALPASVDMSQGAFAFYGLRRLGAAADLFFGARVNYLSGNVRVDGLQAVRSTDASQTWVDPIVGFQFRTPQNGARWHAQVYTEIGGFGAGSEFTWQLFPTIGVSLSERASLEFGYRWLDIDYETGDGAALFKYDVLTQGPVVGFAFRF